MRKLMNAAVAAALVLLLPSAGAAQEAEVLEAEPQETCTATIAPIRAVGPVQATATFDRPFGEVTEIEGPEKAGLKIVKVVEGERADMAAERDAVEAGEAGAAEGENVSVFRIDTSRTPPGTYDVVLKNEAGEACSAQLTVEAPPEGGEG